MKILAILGSRNPQGQTAEAAGALLAAAAEAGAEVDEVFLPAVQIERCRQCEDHGWGTCRSAGVCVIEDDFAGLVARLKAADAAVFATPVYYGDQSESMRAFTDRLRRVVRNDKTGIAGKPAIGVCVAGGGGGGAPTCVVSLEKVLSTCGFNCLDMVPVRRQNLALKKEVLRTTGAWLVQEARPAEIAG